MKIQDIITENQQGVAEGTNDFSRNIEAFRVYQHLDPMEFYRFANTPRGLQILAQKAGTTPESVKDSLERIDWGQFPADFYQDPEDDEQDVSEGRVINTHLWHGSRNKHPVLEPQQAVDTGGAAGSNQNAIYATSDPKVAIAMGLTTPGSDTGMFPNDPQMVLFSGKIRKGENVYLHRLPMNGPDGKPQFVQGGNSREFHSVPGVKGIEPTEIKAVPVNKYLNLIRKATPADLKLRKKYMKKGVAEGCQSYNNKQRRSQMSAKLMRSYLDLLNEQQQQQGITEASGNAAKMARVAKRCARQAFKDTDRPDSQMFLKAAEYFAAGDEARGLRTIERMDTEARDDFYMGCEDAGIPLPTDDGPTSPGFVPASELTPAQKKQRNAFNKALGLPLDEDQTK